jgi:hypothetical protein
VPPTDDYDTHPNGQLLRLNPRECSFSEFMEPLPPCTTPPPRPELRLQSLPPSPSEGEFAVQHSVVATESWAFCSSPSNEEQEYKIAGSVCTFINESLSATDRVCLVCAGSLSPLKMC